MPHLDEGTIHAWLDDQLDADAATAAEAHVAGCAACAEAVAEARGLIAASTRILAALDHVPGGVLPGTASSDGTHPIAGAASRARQPQVATARGHTRWRWGTPRIAAAAVLVLAVGSYAVVRSGGDPAAVSAAVEGRSAAPAPEAFAKADSSPPAGAARTAESVAPPPVAPDVALQRDASVANELRRETAPTAPSAGAAVAPQLAVRDTVVMSAKIAAADRIAVSDSVTPSMPLPTTARLRAFAPVELRVQSLEAGVGALTLEPSAWIGRCFQAAIEPEAVSPRAITDFSRLTAALPSRFRLDSAVTGERAELARFAAVPIEPVDSTMSGWWSVAADTGIRVEFTAAATDRVQLMIAQSAADWPSTRASLYAYGSSRATTLSVHLTPIVCDANPGR
ncbi:MAG TPA: zf-HC2 domain-containing protein [Gemmatimonadaceae bacterium]|nr:zf-HC2 domain-containing protein [Gemmatimonadaceae bacterium]